MERGGGDPDSIRYRLIRGPIRTRRAQYDRPMKLIGIRTAKR